MIVRKCVSDHSKNADNLGKKKLKNYQIHTHTHTHIKQMNIFI